MSRWAAGHMRRSKSAFVAHDNEAGCVCRGGGDKGRGGVDVRRSAGLGGHGSGDGCPARAPNSVQQASSSFLWRPKMLIAFQTTKEVTAATRVGPRPRPTQAGPVCTVLNANEQDLLKFWRFKADAPSFRGYPFRICLGLFTSGIFLCTIQYE